MTDARGPDGTLRIPEDVDRLVLSVTDATGKVELLQKEYPLERDTHRFPLSLALEPGRKTTSPVTIELEGFLAQQPVGVAKASVASVPSEVSNVTIRFDKNQAALLGARGAGGNVGRRSRRAPDSRRC